MKKIITISTILLILICGVVFAFKRTSNTENNQAYLRVHIRANSNAESDQAVKYKVKTAVVDFLTPKIAAGTSFEKAYKILESNLSEIEKVADNVLKENGFSYKSKASLRDEYFPTRSYGSITLENGYYDALILELGTAAGNNWWCVVYPPLCFIGSEGENINNIRYKSKLVEIIKHFFD